MAFKGIRCDTCENILIKNITIDGLNLENVVTYSVPVGILVTDSTIVAIDKLHSKKHRCENRFHSRHSDDSNKFVNSFKLFRLKFINKDGACTGIGHLLCDIAEVNCCAIDNLQSQYIDNDNTEGHTAIGLVPVGSTNLYIKNCKVSNIIGCCDDAHGMSIFECLDAVVEKCEVENVLDGAGAAQTGAKATGIEVYASGVKVVDCKVKNITAINPQDQQATGFSCAQCIGVNFIRCHAENVNVVDENGNQSSSLGYGTGFGWAPDPRPEFMLPSVDILYKHCTAKRCQVGFDSFFHINSVWEDVFSNCNGIAILDLIHSQRTLSCNACSECGCTVEGCYPEPRTITIDNVAENNTFLNVRARYSKNITRREFL